MKKIPNLLSFLLFFAGILLGVTLSVLSMWADLEASFYGFSRRNADALRGLSCPIMLARGESSDVIIKFTNITDETLTPNIKTQISSPLLPVESLDYFDVAPGKSATLEKRIGAENIDLDNFIFVNVAIYSVYPMSDQEATCGVFILPFGGSGKVFLIVGTILSLLLTGCGLFLLKKANLRNKVFGPMLLVAILIVPALVFSFLGWWFLTIFLYVALLLALVIAIGSLVI